MASTRCRRWACLAAVVVVAAALVLARALNGGDLGVADAVRGVPASGWAASTGAADGEYPQTHADTQGASSPPIGVEPISTDELVARVGDASGRREWVTEADVSRTAAEVLDGYAQRGDTVLAHAGWLDLLGSVWGCAVSGPGWVDLCFVEREGETQSRVVVMRMEVDRWEEAYGDAWVAQDP